MSEVRGATPVVILLSVDVLISHLAHSRHHTPSVHTYPATTDRQDIMPSVASIGSIVIKVVKLVINMIILLMYRFGYGGAFLGVGGTWNLNEDKSADSEIIASGIFVGFFIYTSAILISYCFGTTAQKRTLVDIIMNFVGTVMFVAVGGVALHYWTGYQTQHKYVTISSEKQVGIAVGAMCIVEGAIYLIDTVLSCIHFAKDYDLK